MWQYLLVLALTLAFMRWFMKKSSSIPGYDGIPVLGVLPFMGTNPAVTFMEWSNKLGPVFRVKMGMRNVVVLNDYESIYECFSEQWKISSDRPSMGVLDDLRQNHGLLFAKFDSRYHDKKKIMSNSLKRFTGDTNVLEETIQDEMKYMFKEIDLHGGNGFYIKNSFANIFASTICKLSFGKRLAWDDKILTEILDAMEKMINSESDNMYIQLLALCDGLKYIPPFSGAYKRQFVNYKRQEDVIEEIIKEHRMSYNKKNVQDAIDLFFTSQNEEPNNPALTDTELNFIIRDFFNAGIDTTVTYFMWCLLYLAAHEDAQDKIYSEICEQIGQEEYPKYERRDQMPFTLSFMDEIHRLRPVVPFALWRKVIENVVISQISIPKGSTIIPNLWAVHHSSKYFDEPHKIIPDRFVDKISGKFVKSPHVIPFGVGMRKCIGYKLAEKELFLVLCSIIQKYKIFEDPDSPLPDFNDFVFGFVFSPKPFKLRFEKR